MLIQEHIKWRPQAHIQFQAIAHQNKIMVLAGLAKL